MADRFFTTVWIYSESMGVFGRLCDAENALVELEPDARLIPDKPDGDYRFDPTANEWVVNPVVEPTIEEKRAMMPQLSPVQFRDILRGIITEAYPTGIRSSMIVAKINEIEDDNAREQAQDYWDRALFYERTNPWVDRLGAMFGFTPEQIDDYWPETPPAPV